MNDKDRAQLAMFGVRPDGRLVMERVEDNRCEKCNGFGTYGNPLCGALYNCAVCKGTGHNPNGVVTKKVTPESKSEFNRRGFFEKIINFFKSE